MIDNKLVLASAISLALGLTGCGGGGGGDSAAPIDETIDNVSVGGTAAKGIVKRGVVTAQELDAAGNALRVLGSAITGDDGKYNLVLNNTYKGGPIEISITRAADTELKCDVAAGCGTRTDGLADSSNPAVIDFGEWYKPAALTMTALLPVAQANETLSVNVTPFTHMAAVRAKAATTLDAAAVANANSEVSNLLGGIDILNTPPIDVTDSAALSGASSATQVTYAALASALSNQGIVDSNGQPDLNAAITLLANSFVNGIIEADDADGDGDDAAQISLQEIVTAAGTTFTAAGITDATGKLDSLQANIDFAESGDGTINPEPTTTAADPNLDKVKAMISDVRTWGNVIQAETKTRGAAFEAQVALASDAIGIFGATDPVDALDASIDAAFNFVNGNTDISTYNLGLNTFDSGTIDSPAAGVITITDGLVHGYTVNITINMPEDGATASSFNLAIVSAAITGSDNTMTINNGLANVTFATDYTVDHTAIDLGTAEKPKATDLTINLDVVFTQNVDSAGAKLVSPVSFAGTLASDLDVIPVINNPLDDMALPKNLNLTGVISNTLGDSVTASLAVNVTNTASFQFVGDAYPVGTLYSDIHPGESLVQWAYSDADTTSGNDTFTYITPIEVLSIYWNASNSNVTNSYSYTNYFTNLSDLVANNVYFWGDYINETEGEYYFDSAGADLTVDGSIDGVLQFSNDMNFPVGTLYSDNHSPAIYWAYTDTDAIPGNDTFTIAKSYGTDSYYWNAANNTITQSNTYQSGAASLAEAVTSYGGFYPYNISFWIDGEGRYLASVAGADFSMNGQVVGELVEPDYINETDTTNGWADLDIGLTFVAQLAGLPEARINVTADRTGFQAGDGAVTITYGNRQLALLASLTSNAVNGALTITNQDNVVLTFADTNLDLDGPTLSGAVKLNGIEYGTVTETASGFLKISYIDGTFEIF